MLRLAPALMIAAVSASAAEAAEPPALCQALHRLADEARRTGEPQRFSVQTGDRAPFFCGPVTPGPATEAACGALSNEPPSVAAWMIAECVQTVAADPQITTGLEASGYKTRKTIAHLTAKLGGGARLDVAEAPPGADPPPFGFIHRRVDVVVWRPK
jgi:hypothetical protein